MCTSKPRAPTPIPNAPSASPTSVDDVAVTAQRQDMLRQRLRQGRQSTILAGNTGQPPTVPSKTALGM